jgi:prepilin-type N-terminal cleavage/methylation domain-containing protein
MFTLGKMPRSGGFTLIELLVPLAIIAVLITDLTGPTLDGVRESAVAAARYPELQAVASRVLDSAGSQVGAAESPVEQVIGRARFITMAEQEGQVPNVQELSAILDELHAGEADLGQERIDLRDLAPLHGTAAREAYLELQRGLAAAIGELRALEVNFERQRQIVELLQ